MLANFNVNMTVEVGGLVGLDIIHWQKEQRKFLSNYGVRQMDVILKVINLPHMTLIKVCGWLIITLSVP